LALFVSRIRADDPQRAATAHVLAFHTDFFDRCFDFHVEKQLRLETASDTCAAAIGIELDSDFIADQNPNPVQSHLAGEVRDR
jgi:hypothetical protein